MLMPPFQSAFGAFAREGLANQKKAVQRNFSSDDVSRSYQNVFFYHPKEYIF